MKVLVRIAVLVLLLCRNEASFVSAEILFRAAFGSCNHQDLEVYANPVFNAIASEGVDEWWWLGDIGYLDERLFLWWSQPHTIFRHAPNVPTHSKGSLLSTPLVFRKQDERNLG